MMLGAADKPGVAPFEVIRLLVALGGVPEQLRFTDEQIERE